LLSPTLVRKNKPDSLSLQGEIVTEQAPRATSPIQSRGEKQKTSLGAGSAEPIKTNPLSDELPDIPEEANEIESQTQAETAIRERREQVRDSTNKRVSPRASVF
jgi:hypothetical protein